MDIDSVMGVLDKLEVVVIFAILTACLALKKHLVAWLKAALCIDQLRAETLRNTILINIHNTPKKAEVIEDDYTAYKALGGNGYLDGVIAEWREHCEGDLIAKRIGK
ncbi:MAG: hypothetical protein LBU07_05145 [Coriobacteriales bacterium]|jgi:hypothetical protein|nr:hypothetical protein [Coriobacteriales bacterium]